MIGWVPKILVGFLDQLAGAEMRTQILLEAGLGADASQFRLDADVPDPACRRVIDVACTRLGVTEEQAFEAFAPYFLQAARSDFPGFFRGVTSTRAFLLRQPAIHNTIAAGLRGPQRKAVSDKFRVEPVPNGIRVFYHSTNRLSGLYKYVAKELARSFGEQAEVVWESGTPQEAKCVLRVALSPQPTQPQAAAQAELVQA